MEAFQLFLGAVIFFHLSEFLITYTYNRADLSWRSFLISKPYCVAMSAACVEYALETRLAPAIKLQAVSWVGLAVVIAGELVRKAAMITAKHNFTHLIQFQKREGHELVQHGIYRWVRHPGYMGWFMWAVGTQLLLVNPICIVGFAAVTWQFFNHRIPLEEQTLVRFFGPVYEQYRARVPSGVPFVR